MRMQMQNGYGMPPKRPRGDFRQSSVTRGNPVVTNDARQYVKTSGTMAALQSSLATTLTFPVPVDILQVTGFGLLGTPAINGLDSFSVQVARETGDKLFTADVPAA